MGKWNGDWDDWEPKEEKGDGKSGWRREKRDTRTDLRSAKRGIGDEAAAAEAPEPQQTGWQPRPQGQYGSAPRIPWPAPADPSKGVSLMGVSVDPAQVWGFWKVDAPDPRDPSAMTYGIKLSCANGRKGIVWFHRDQAGRDAGWEALAAAKDALKAAGQIR
jgi:hypothetical protein